MYDYNINVRLDQKTIVALLKESNRTHQRLSELVRSILNTHICVEEEKERRNENVRTEN